MPRVPKSKLDNLKRSWSQFLTGSNLPPQDEPLEYPLDYSFAEPLEEPRAEKLESVYVGGTGSSYNRPQIYQSQIKQQINIPATTTTDWIHNGDLFKSQFSVPLNWSNISAGQWFEYDFKKTPSVESLEAKYDDDGSMENIEPE